MLQCGLSAFGQKMYAPWSRALALWAKFMVIHRSSELLAVCVVCECVQGKNCTFSHDCEIIRKSELCKFYLLSTCTKGLACPYYHDILSVLISLMHYLHFLASRCEYDPDCIEAGTEWPVLCWCAVKKLLTHWSFFVNKIIQFILVSVTFDDSFCMGWCPVAQCY